jgi:hypothetical protein
MASATMGKVELVVSVAGKRSPRQGVPSQALSVCSATENESKKAQVGVESKGSPDGINQDR